jgi:hypothetical protein
MRRKGSIFNAIPLAAEATADSTDRLSPRMRHVIVRFHGRRICCRGVPLLAVAVDHV